MRQLITPDASLPAGAGLGLRSQFMRDLLEPPATPPDFLEIIPENWLGIGGKRRKTLAALREHYPFTAHGLCLSIGGQQPLNYDFLQQLKSFFREFHIDSYSEHLSYCHDGRGYLYELLPLPFTEEAVKHVSARVQSIQDFLGFRIALENPSYYYSPATELTEIAFINAVVEQGDCELLLDLNNVYVNSINHRYDAKDFIDQLAIEKIQAIHIAGHLLEDTGLILDTHGSRVDDAVWELLAYFYKKKKQLPTVLERDQNIPALALILAEVSNIKRLQQENE